MLDTVSAQGFFSNSINISNFWPLRSVHLIVIFMGRKFWPPKLKNYTKNASHVFDIHLNSEHCTYLSNIAAIGVVTNSVLNPVIYSFLSTNFRQKVSRRTRNFIRMRKCNFYEFYEVICLNIIWKPEINRDVSDKTKPINSLQPWLYGNVRSQIAHKLYKAFLFLHNGIYWWHNRFTILISYHFLSSQQAKYGIEIREG